MGDLIRRVEWAVRIFTNQPGVIDKHNATFRFSVGDCAVSIVVLDPDIHTEEVPPSVDVRAVMSQRVPARLKVYHGYVYPIGRAFGIQDLTVGDYVFDDRFIIKGNDEALVRLWLDEEVRRSMLGGDRVRFMMDRSRVFCTGFPGTTETAEAQLRATIALATRPERLHEALRALATHFGGGVSAAPILEGARMEAKLEGVPFTVEPRFAPIPRLGRKSVLHTVLATKRTELATDDYLIVPEGKQRGFKALEIHRHVALFKSEPEMQARLTKSAIAEINALAPSSIQPLDEQLVIHLPGFETDTEKIARALRLLQSLDSRQGAGSGPYR